MFCLDISDLLQLIAQKYGDLDIQDRARFYHQLLLTVSGEKVIEMITYVVIYTCMYMHAAFSNRYSGFRLRSWIQPS